MPVPAVPRHQYLFMLSLHNPLYLIAFVQPNLMDPYSSISILTLLFTD